MAVTIVVGALLILGDGFASPPLFSLPPDAPPPSPLLSEPTGLPALALAAGDEDCA